MKTRIFIILLLILFAFSIVIPVSGQSGSIVLGGADESNTFSMTSSQPLITLISNIGARFVIEFADAKHEFPLISPPTGLFTLIDQVANRFVLQYANDTNMIPVTFPKSIINDKTPPKISTVSAQGMGIITWTTDEYATSKVIYEPTIVADTVEINNPLFTKQHQVMLTGLTPGQEYTYRVSSTDRSGNTSTSSEFNFAPQESLTTYLPIIVGSR